jgi:uncharacterized protein (DUF1778 family)
MTTKEQQIKFRKEKTEKQLIHMAAQAAMHAIRKK